MTRFAWLQARSQTLIVAGLLAILAVLAAVTGVQLAHLYSSLVAPCRASGADCGFAMDRFISHDSFLQGSLQLLQRLAPAIIGAFWGAPLVARELETGTSRLVWTQTVTRRRWLLSKVAVVGLASAVAAGVLSLTVTWWFRSLDQISGTQFGDFDARGVVPIGYTLAAFAFGVLAGVLIRRTVPAMAASIAAFVFARIAVQQWVRPHLLPPRHLTSSLLKADGFGFISQGGGPLDLVVKGSGPPGSWVLSSQLVDHAGHATTTAQRMAFLHKYCPFLPTPTARPKDRVHIGPADDQNFRTCQQAASRAYHVALTYQPKARYWPFQWLEAGVFVLLAAAALAGCYWVVTRRLAS
ncbi:MAG: ABC transporter permease subunit [Frankiales bacterium]|nr:ABC transporter permease subunit [Frankiales bacterium]